MEQVVEIPTSAWPTGIAWISGNLQEACLQRFFTSVGTLARRTTAPSRHLLLRRYSNVLLSETSCSGKCASSVSRPGPAITALNGAKNRELASGGKFEHCRGWFMHSHRPCNLLAAAGRMPVPHGTSPRPVFFLVGVFPLFPDRCPSPQRGEIYKWHQSAECEPAGRCPALRTTLWLKHIQGPPAPEAGWSPF